MYEILIDTNKFEFYGKKEIKDYDKMFDDGKSVSEFKLEIGDLVYRKEKAHYEYLNEKRISVTDIPGHVEFYIGNDKVVGWGKIQKKNFEVKKFYKNQEQYYFYTKNQYDYDQPFTKIIRLKRYEDEKEK